MSLLPVKEALNIIENHAQKIAFEEVEISAALDRILAEDIFALRASPPYDASSMDGYAIFFNDISKYNQLKISGEVKTGDRERTKLNIGEAIRIFTGGILPANADTIIIQENCEKIEKPEGAYIKIIKKPKSKGEYVRQKGLDYKKGDLICNKGKKITPRDMAVIASSNHKNVKVSKAPKVAIIATGDEIVKAGEALDDYQIIGSATYSLKGLVEKFGGKALIIEPAKDKKSSVIRAIKEALDADIFITIGGASVGKYDIIKDVLAELGLKIDFWRIAMRPGKPLFFGNFKNGLFLGFPGNPVAVYVCANLFLKPLIAKMMGTACNVKYDKAICQVDLDENDQREDYLRALCQVKDGQLYVTPFEIQDSSMQLNLANANCLAIRKPFAKKLIKGETIDIIHLDY